MSVSEERPYHHGRLREALLEAAESTLREHGQDQLSLRKLARDIGVSHAAPGRHFPDRQALLDALAVAGFERLDRELRKAVAAAPADDFPARLDAAVAAYLHFATQDAALLELMFSGKHRPGAEEVRAASEAGFGLMEGMIREGQESGHLEQGSSEQVGMVLFATMQGIATLVNGDMIGRSQMDALVERAVAQFLRGTRPA
ncbi:TetR/AcrR family transcriptional regulator [Brachybacterium sacelli]|uniref:AcrR family transcriptional regulator n=1 Tax=Brachybacterium sacelli TaxID=173364 RepID=A0ABS4WXP4_9MICO|nr:TetR/AcrR family transcriptional regulator [Brachybacterium sacelli]MBP2380974.1 AcrR family transcriptional regulator [Brachybacterium sacelli]